jgi:NAD(P)-dependent dehydrogenase (short-subunit alcohol dehydrogenase family)
MVSVDTLVSANARRSTGRRRYHRAILSALRFWCDRAGDQQIEGKEMRNSQKTVIITGASQGIGAGLVQSFLARGHRVVANSRNITKTAPFPESENLALIDGQVGDPHTATRIADAAVSRFGGIDVLVNNAGMYISKPFTDYTLDDLRSVLSVDIEGFLFFTQLAIRRMLEKQTGGSIINITTSLVDQPIAGVNAAVPMITKGGLEAVTRSLAIEYAKQGIRVNAVAPGTVDTPRHRDEPKEFLRALQPMGRIADVADIVDAVLYLADADQVTGEVLHVDGGAHAGKW